MVTTDEKIDYVALYSLLDNRLVEIAKKEAYSVAVIKADPYRLNPRVCSKVLSILYEQGVCADNIKKLGGVERLSQNSKVVNLTCYKNLRGK